MLIPNPKSFALGLVMAITFLLVFIFLFTPSFRGQNAFEAADDLFNSIAKGSTYYVPGLIERVESCRGTPLSVSLRLGTDGSEAEAMLNTSGIEASAGGDIVEVNGDLGSMLRAVLHDSDLMFHNRGDEILAKYGVPEKQVILIWWKTLAAIERALNSQSRFADAALVAEVKTRGVEVAYNFYGVEPEQASSKAGVLFFSLVFYVLYTLWWGYAIFFLTEGVGLRLVGGAKKEV